MDELHQDLQRKITCMQMQINICAYKCLHSLYNTKNTKSKRNTATDNVHSLSLSPVSFCLSFFFRCLFPATENDNVPWTPCPGLTHLRIHAFSLVGFVGLVGLVKPWHGQCQGGGAGLPSVLAKQRVSTRLQLSVQSLLPRLRRRTTSHNATVSWILMSC